MDDRQRERPAGALGRHELTREPSPTASASSAGVRGRAPETRRWRATSPRVFFAMCETTRLTPSRSSTTATCTRAVADPRETASRPRRTWRSGSPRPAARRRPRRAPREGRPASRRHPARAGTRAPDRRAQRAELRRDDHDVARRPRGKRGDVERGVQHAGVEPCSRRRRSPTKIGIEEPLAQRSQDGEREAREVDGLTARGHPLRLARRQQDEGRSTGSHELTGIWQRRPLPG